MIPIYLSVVMPVYNDENLIAESIRKVEAFMVLKEWEWELIISNDGSTDGTKDIIEEIISRRSDKRVRLVSLDKNMKKGAAVRQGVLASKGEFVLVTDTDLSSPIKEVDKLLTYLENGCQIAIGSRYSRPAVRGLVKQSFKRQLSGKIFNCLVRGIALKGFSDTQCGFKCFEGQTARKLFQDQKIDGFCYDVEILCLAKKARLAIKEVPVMWRQADDTHVRLFDDSLTMIRDLWTLRKKYLKFL